jgi:phosphatidylinositol-3,4,5-trisphosphate 3-phosphatase and dual-specificity protein phosphatase PTEN
MDFRSAPPLALLPLAAREMHAWLQGSPDRVIVLHCKGGYRISRQFLYLMTLPTQAGKGRSGTLACSYLLSLEDSPAPPRLERSYSAKQWARARADTLMQAMPDDDTSVDLEVREQVVLETEGHSPTSKSYDVDETGLLKPPPPIIGRQRSKSPRPMTPPSASSSSSSVEGQGLAANSFSGPLKNVLDLHTSRRMKSSASNAKLKQGVSIPSQRRWLYYWSLLLVHQGPANFWPLSPGPDVSMAKVRITQIKVRMKEMSNLKKNLVKAANIVIGRTGRGKGDDNGHVWVSLARYDDELVGKLEMWERRTRDESGHLGRRKRGSEHGEGDDLVDLFADQRWDKGKMVRNFARMGVVGVSSTQKANSDKVGL